MVYNDFTPSYTKKFPSVNERFIFCGSFKFPGCEDNFFNFSRKTELCKGLPDRVTAKSWSFRDSEWAFDGLNRGESVFKPEGSWMGVVYQMDEHCWKPVLCCFHKFRYGCSYKIKRGKCIYLMSFTTEIKSIHCNAIWVWHARDIFVYMFAEKGDKQIDLWIKLKPVTQYFKQLVGEHPFCVVIEYSRHFVCQCVLYTRNVAWRNLKTSVLCKFPYTFCNIITNNRMHASHIVNVC